MLKTEIDTIFNTYLAVRESTPRTNGYKTIIVEESTPEVSDVRYTQVKRINIFIKTQSGTIENRYSAKVEAGGVNSLKGTVTIIGEDEEYHKSIQVVISKDSPTSVIVQGTESEHPDLVRFENDLSFFQRDDPKELNIFINE
jgi:hypothetical protein